MSRIHNSYHTSPQFYIGIVEDRNDNLYMGRCRVRIFGLHDEDKIVLPTEDLPWAVPLMPITSASVSGVGTSATGLVHGSRVLVTFADRDFQYPIMMGSLPGFNESNPFGEFENSTTLNKEIKYDEFTDEKKSKPQTPNPGPANLINSPGQDVREVAEGAIAAAGVAISAAGDVIASAIGSANSAISGLSSELSSAIGQLPSGLQNAANSMVSGLQNQLGGAISGIESQLTGAIAGANDAINGAISSLEGLAGDLSAMGESVMTAFGNIGTLVDPERIGEELKYISEYAGAAVDKGVDNAAALISAGKLKLEEITSDDQQNRVAGQIQEAFSEFDPEKIQEMLDNNVDLNTIYNDTWALAEKGASALADLDITSDPANIIQDAFGSTVDDAKSLLDQAKDIAAGATSKLDQAKSLAAKVTTIV